ncbi:endo alpha-1,4 polygalactosaminidase [Gracilimonas mengyeensis]|uniref:Glycoside-hydrolase family GH114 TIM-barrel domain-containing protein n=1 Tax=Gracilimonas mengyeensis TaxID=1302730 RepID=A0A521E0C6_9BACT|nr:endo alpha-1,4 polygalactosaminidase [Gracilimonas mengyeensis]SMO77332.1 cysteinyl-tRNA synthetase, unknown class [Gracilimonas mengyeensis]
MRTLLPFLLFLFITSFACGIIGTNDTTDYRAEMRSFVQEIADYAHEQDEDFIVIPQNGHELLTVDDSPATEYLNAIDGLGQEDLFFGYEEDNQPTPARATNRLLEQLAVGKDTGKTVLVTDYCHTPFKANQSYSQNQALDFLSFAAPERDLTVIPDYPENLPGENDRDITQLSEAENFLYLLNMQEFDTKADYISAIQNTNYDVLIMDAFWNKNLFTDEDVEALRQKENGGKRLVISYMSIGEAEDYRFYWQPGWHTGNPNWLVRENPNWEGNYKVKYWDPEWKRIIYNGEDSYLQKILNSRFDGVYLDIIDGFYFFENR